jgi:hypothetical protein
VEGAAAKTRLRMAVMIRKTKVRIPLLLLISHSVVTFNDATFSADMGPDPDRIFNDDLTDPDLIGRQV